ncbi:aminoacyl-tRNA hydrolase [Ectothiorhodospiraceae bacterium 2226]|nr:aminoacyl-tRNA hydrolase [Ectothiorhodospiraceae bacterium 2226]
MISINHQIALPPEELEFHFIRSAGPGGQNVNKVASAVQLRFDAAHSPSLPEPVRARLRSVAGRRMSADGVIVITARTHRSQARNRDEAVQRLIALIQQAATAPTRRKATRPSRAQRERRLADKRRRSERKRARSSPGTHD